MSKWWNFGVDGLELLHGWDQAHGWVLDQGIEWGMYFDAIVLYFSFSWADVVVFYNFGIFTRLFRLHLQGGWVPFEREFQVILVGYFFGLAFCILNFSPFLVWIVFIWIFFAFWRRWSGRCD